MNMTDTKLDEKTISRLMTLLQEKEKCNVELRRGIREYWFLGCKTETELRILILFDIQITVSRVNFINKRQGTMTEVLAIIEQFCLDNKISRIVIQSVETPEMSKWCFKNDFKPVPTASFDFEGFVAGDFEKMLKG